MWTDCGCVLQHCSRSGLLPSHRPPSHLEGSQQSHTYLHPPPLPVRHLVHAPLRVNVQHLDQPLLAGFLHPGYGVDHAARGEVTLCGVQVQVQVQVQVGVCRQVCCEKLCWQVDGRVHAHRRATDRAHLWQ